jgi:hypothetical protein
MIEAACEKAKALRLKTIGNQLPQVMETAEESNWPTLKTIDHLFELEIESRRLNRIALRFRQSKLTEKLTIDQFDFDHHSSRKKQKTRLLSLMSLEFFGSQDGYHFDWQSRCRKNLPGQGRRLYGHPGRQEGPFYHRHGYDQSLDRSRG